MIMIEEPDFEMCIVEIFRFGDGRTVLVGDIQGFEGVIRASQCQLFIDATLVEEFEIEGEMLPEKRMPNPQRSISTTNDVKVTGKQIEGSECRLIGKLL